MTTTGNTVGFKEIAETIKCPMCNGRLNTTYATIDTPYSIWHGYCNHCKKRWIIKIHTRRRLLKIYEPEGWWNR